MNRNLILKNISTNYRMAHIFILAILCHYITPGSPAPVDNENLGLDLPAAIEQGEQRNPAYLPMQCVDGITLTLSTTQKQR
ncbi:hypothetical protein SeMB42_g02968 [Synchytrium endobioticum]|uniref:Uncharacterized protein n=1 Tax=Synchytrium endobioticum TaxID=286115 RepID=A0A507DAG3_9FUNG|nr:hypothetical protein SeMB42_g02968 [Synchytrium endobioticum]